MEENIVTSLQDTMDTEAQDENVKSAGAKTSSGAQNAALERRIRQELEEQGLLAAEERSNVNETDDEILTELRRCQGELRAISQHNFQQLNKLHRMALDEMKRQEVRKKLAAADNEVRIFFGFFWRAERVLRRGHSDRTFCRGKKLSWGGLRGLSDGVIQTGLLVRGKSYLGGLRWLSDGVGLLVREKWPRFGWLRGF